MLFPVTLSLLLILAILGIVWRGWEFVTKKTFNFDFILKRLPKLKRFINHEQNNLFYFDKSSLYKNRWSWWRCLAISISFGLFLSFLNYTFYNLIPAIKDEKPPTSYDEFFKATIFKHDSGHYLNIAQFGYVEDGDYGWFLLAFYPLYPFLLWLTHSVLPIDVEVGAIILNIFIVTTAIYFLFRLVSGQFGVKVAQTSVFLLLIFPVSFFLFLPYTEGLFLLCSILTFYCCSQKKLLLAATVGLLATLTRTQGILTIIPIILTVYDLYKWQKPRLYLLACLPLLGSVCYLLINQAVSGDWLTFLEMQRKIWFQKPQLIFHTFLDHQDYFQAEHFNNHFTINNTNYFLYRFAMWGVQIFFLIQSFLLLIYGALKKIDGRYLIFSLVYLIMSFSITNTISGTRFIFALFPLYIFMALFLERRPILKAGYMLFNIVLLVLFWGIYAFTWGAIV